MFSNTAQVSRLCKWSHWEAAQKPSTAETALMRRDKRTEECILQSGKGWRGESELCLSWQPEMPLVLSTCWKPGHHHEGFLHSWEAYPKYLGIWGIQLSRLPRSLSNSKNAASPVSVIKYCHIIAEVSMFMRNILVIWMFSTRQKFLLGNYWKNLPGGVRHVAAYCFLKSSMI